MLVRISCSLVAGMDAIHFDKISCKNANICNSTAFKAEKKSSQAKKGYDQISMDDSK